MEEDAGPAGQARRVRHDLSTRFTVAIIFGLLSPILPACSLNPPGDSLARAQKSGSLVCGSDKEGGGPYAFPNPDSPREVAGFEVDLMNEVAKDLKTKAVFSQGQWDRLLQQLDSGRLDLVVNGYEWTETRARDYLATRPYYVYQLQLLASKTSPLRSWDDVRKPPAGEPGRKWKIGVLVESAADNFAGNSETAGPSVEVVRFDGATDAMMAAANGQIDATLQDLPAAIYYRDRFPKLTFAGSPVGHGYYVVFCRKGDEPLRHALDASIEKLIQSGRLKTIYERYGIWNEAQKELATITPDDLRPAAGSTSRGWVLIERYGPLLIDASWVTIVLSCTAMPLAMALGLIVAIGRLHGPRPLAVLLSLYVELLRGTPLMLQLYVLFYLLKLPPWIAGIGGLAINYSAYEAEIYRAGLQAIPAGQMEAARALGMSRPLALRRIILPQAIRIVIPPVTNDFIALFKDTSVCSVITLVELTKQYSILANSTGGVVEFALATCVLYLGMSVPLSFFSRWSERRLDASDAKGGSKSS